jgi:hypothetical protein
LEQTESITGGSTVSEPSTSEEELLKQRPLTNATDLLKMTPISASEAAPILQEAYKKHSTEQEAFHRASEH